MTPLKCLSASLLVALCVACSDSPTGTSGESVFILVPAQLAVSSGAKAQLVNHSGGPIHVGAISCGVQTDRRTDAGWIEVPRPGNECPQPDFLLANGAAYTFVFSTPTTPGDFRLRIGAEDTVFSNVFAVR